MSEYEQTVRMASMMFQDTLNQNTDVTIEELLDLFKQSDGINFFKIEMLKYFEEDVDPEVKKRVKAKRLDQTFLEENIIFVHRLLVDLIADFLNLNEATRATYRQRAKNV